MNINTRGELTVGVIGYVYHLRVVRLFLEDGQQLSRTGGLPSYQVTTLRR